MNSLETAPHSYFLVVYGWLALPVVAVGVFTWLLARHAVRKRHAARMRRWSLSPTERLHQAVADNVSRRLK